MFGESLQIKRVHGVAQVAWPAKGGRRFGPHVLRRLAETDQTSCIVDLKDYPSSRKPRQLVRQLRLLHRGLLNRGGILALARPGRQVLDLLATELPQIPCCRTFKDARLLIKSWEKFEGTTTLVAINRSPGARAADIGFVTKLLDRGLTVSQVERLLGLVKREERSNRTQKFFLYVGGVFALTGGALLAMVTLLSGALFFATLGVFMILVAASPGLIGGSGLTQAEAESLTKVAKDLVAGPDGIYRAKEDRN